MGFTAIVAQVLLIRELLVTFSGNELSIGIFLANWLLLEALGSYLAGKLASKIKSSIPYYVLIQFLISIFFPIIIYYIRTIKLNLGFLPGEGINLFTLFNTSLLLLLPIALLGGAQFSIACRIYSEWHEKKATSIGKVYILEAIGSILGGITVTYICLQFLNSFQSAYVVAGANLLSALLLLFIFYPGEQKIAYKMIKTLQILIVSSVICLLISLYFKTPFLLNDKSVQQQWHGYKIISYGNSIYGNVTLLKHMEQFILLSNGVPIATSPLPDITFTEEFIHIPMLYHPNPRDVALIGSGMGGVIQEILKHPIDNIDYTELDPLIIKTLQKNLNDSIMINFKDPRIKIHFIDGRYFLRITKKKYDLIFLNLPEPSTLEINRFYTYEFFKTCQKRLKHNGILVFVLPGSASYMSHEMILLNVNLLKTAKQVFCAQKVIPDNYNLVLQSDDTLLWHIDIETLSYRLKQRKIKARLISEGYLRYKLDDQRSNWFWNEIKDAGDLPINSDFLPSALYFNLALANSIDTPQFAQFFNHLRFLKIWHIIIGIMFIFVILFFIRHLSVKINIILPIFTTGFSSMGITVVLILAFQSFYGYIYQWIGLIITAFMGGLTVGGLIMNRLLGKAKANRHLFIKIELLIFIYCIILVALLSIVSSIGEYSLISVITKITILVMALLCGFLVGVQFPLANKLYLHTEKDLTQTAGILYSSDLIGAWIGGLAVSIVFIPILGILLTVAIFVLTKLASLLIISSTK